MPDPEPRIVTPKEEAIIRLDPGGNDLPGTLAGEAIVPSSMERRTCGSPAAPVSTTVRSRRRATPVHRRSGVASTAAMPSSPPKIPALIAFLHLQLRSGRHSLKPIGRPSSVGLIDASAIRSCQPSRRRWSPLRAPRPKQRQASSTCRRKRARRDGDSCSIAQYRRRRFAVAARRRTGVGDARPQAGNE